MPINEYYQKKITKKKRKETENYTGRTYTDYLEYKVQNPNVTTTEMDTVYNNHLFIREILGGKTPYKIFTFIYEEKLTYKLNIQEIVKDEVNYF